MVRRHRQRLAHPIAAGAAQHHRPLTPEAQAALPVERFARQPPSLLMVMAP
jgi:hypothetical protein